jgi:hypothetical protein
MLFYLNLVDLNLGTKNDGVGSRDREQGEWGEGKKRCEIWERQGNKTLLCVKVQFNHCG